MSVLRRPIITEKSLLLATNRQYTFAIDRRATSLEVARDVAKAYSVTVQDVHVVNTKGHDRRFRGHLGKTGSTKKAIVTVKKGQSIPGFELETDKPAGKRE